MNTIDDTYKYSSVELARYIIAKANNERIGINITKLQKLLYIAYGLFLAVKKQRLVDEHPHAWPYGPVFPRTRKMLLNEDFYSISISDDAFERLRKDEELNQLLKLVFDNFGKYTAYQLTNWSHQDGSPWDTCVSKEGFKWNDEMPDSLLLPFFSWLMYGGTKK